jgi:diguanylate cyclase (GGDEF)-like protein
VTGRVGVLSPFVGGDYYGALIAGVNQAATEAGTAVIAIQTLDPGARSADESGVPDFRRPISWQHLDGLIVLPGAILSQYALRAQAVGKAVVLVSHDLAGVDCPRVFADNRSGVRESVAHLIEHGHQRIAFGGNLGVNDVRERYEGYREALSQHAIEVLPELLFAASDNHETGGVEVANLLIQAGMPATAMVLGTDRNAIGLIQQLLSADYDLPDRLAVVSFDNIADTRFIMPSIASVHQPLDQLGARAFELLQQELTGSAGSSSGLHHVPTTFIRRESCGCPGTGLQLTEEQARHQFHDNAYLQMTLNTQYELAVELLRTHQQDPRQLAWLGRTPALGGCLGLWTDGAQLPAPIEVEEHQDDPSIDLVGAFRAEGELEVVLEAATPVSHFPPAALFALADGAVGDVVFVVPVRTQAHDWGVMAAVGRIQHTTPPGREMMNHSGALLGVALDHDDMLRALMEQEERLRRAALYDQLTGLPNRTLLFDRLHQTGLRSSRHDEHQFALLFIDLDGFKAVNDTYGHAAGDELLVQVSHRLREIIRDSDTAARLGGDEFVILLDDTSAPNGPQPVIERIEHSLSEPITINGAEVTVGASIGLARSSDGYADIEDLLKRADEAMYQAKVARRAPGHRV